jgi:hypothetical protein
VILRAVGTLRLTALLLFTVGWTGIISLLFLQSANTFTVIVSPALLFAMWWTLQPFYCIVSSGVFTESSWLKFIGMYQFSAHWLSEIAIWYSVLWATMWLCPLPCRGSVEDGETCGIARRCGSVTWARVDWQIDRLTDWMVLLKTLWDFGRGVQMCDRRHNTVGQVAVQGPRYSHAALLYPTQPRAPSCVLWNGGRKRYLSDKIIILYSCMQCGVW